MKLYNSNWNNLLKKHSVRNETVLVHVPSNVSSCNNLQQGIEPVNMDYSKIEELRYKKLLTKKINNF